MGAAGPRFDGSLGCTVPKLRHGLALRGRGGADWLQAGARLVWVIDPVGETARVYRADASEALLTRNQLLDGEDVMPGFLCDMS